MPLRTSLPATAHMHLFLTATRFIVLCLPPHKSVGNFHWAFCSYQATTIHLSSTHQEGKIWNVGVDFTEGCRRVELAQPRGRGPVEAAEWVWPWGHTLPKEEGRMEDSEGLVTELPLTPAQAESSEGHLCSCPEDPLWQWVSLSLAVSVPQGVGGRHAAMDPAGVQHAQHPDGCGAPSGAAGPEAAAAAGQGDWYLPCPQGALLTVFWCVARGEGCTILCYLFLFSFSTAPSSEYP